LRNFVGRPAHSGEAALTAAARWDDGGRAAPTVGLECWRPLVFVVLLLVGRSWGGSSSNRAATAQAVED